VAQDFSPAREAIVKIIRSTSRILAAGAALLLLPALAGAQELVTSFDQLNTRLKPGDTVYVTDAQGRETKGRILELRPSSLVLDAGQPQAFSADQVRAIKKPGGLSVRKAALWGALTGVAAGVVLVAVDHLGGGSVPQPPCPPASEPTCMLPPPPASAASDWYHIPADAALGAGLGTLVGYLFPGKQQVVYRAPGATGASSARFSLAPLITPRHNGVAVSFSF